MRNQCGLFARTPLPRNSVLGSFKNGRAVSHTTYQEYKQEGKHTHFADIGGVTYDCSNLLVGMMNRTPKSTAPNCRLLSNGTIKTTTEIVKGEELHMRYGHSYRIFEKL